MSECEQMVVGTSNIISRIVVEPVFIEPKVVEKIVEKPVTLNRWKCHTCYTVFNDDQKVDNKCPVCGEIALQKMCIRDHVHCTHEQVSGIKYCDVCGQPVCPICDCHNVFQISRVTGYLQDVKGWNEGKKQELKDRNRTNNIETVLH